MYILDRTYEKFRQHGIHYYKLATLINYFAKFGNNDIVIRYGNAYKLVCEIVK